MPETGYLTYAPEGDPRPGRYDARVIRRAIGAHQGALDAWMQAKGAPGFSASDADEVVEAFVNGGVSPSGFNAFICVTELCFRYGMPVDPQGARALLHMADSFAFCRRLETHEWVMKNAIRVPAAEGDVVHFSNAEGRRFFGHVIALNRPNATAVVERHSDNVLVSVPAENIFANLTQDRKASATTRPVRLGEIEAAERPPEAKKVVKFEKPSSPPSAA